MNGSRSRRIRNVLVNVGFYACLLLIAWIVLRIFFFASYHIPSSSMEPALEPGDNILVSKLIPGPRLFNLLAAINGRQVAIHRLPGIRHIRRNDIIVCNMTHPNGNWGKISMDVMRYYVKRCIAIPGDSLEIRKGFYHVKGLDLALGDTLAQAYLSAMGKENIKKNIYRTYPGDSLLGWNILNFGPFYLPRKGDSIPMNRKNYLLYKQAIEWEQGKPLVYRDSSFLIGGRSLLGYRFRESYYFVGGDRVENSQDSRYWGLLPEDYIAGKVVLVWESDAPFTEKFR